MRTAPHEAVIIGTVVGAPACDRAPVDASRLAAGCGSHPGTHTHANVTTHHTLTTHEVESPETETETQTETQTQTQRGSSMGRGEVACMPMHNKWSCSS